MKQTLGAPTHFINAVAFSLDGSLIASGSGSLLVGGSRDTVKLWDVKTGGLKQSIEGDRREATSVAFSPDGSLLAWGNDGADIILWDLKKGEMKGALVFHDIAVKSITFSPDGSLLASGSGDKSVKLWDLKKQEVKQTLVGHTGEVKSVAFSPDGSLLASGSRDKSVKLWDVKKGKVKQTLEGHTGEVKSVTFSPRGDFLVSGSGDKTLRVWQLGVNRVVNCQLTSLESSINSLAFKQTVSGETLLISGHSDKSVRCWKLIMVEEKPYLRLEWSTHQNVLLFQATNLEGVKKLSADNEELLKQRGVIGNLTGFLEVLHVSDKSRDVSTSLAATRLMFSSAGSSVQASRRDVELENAANQAGQEKKQDKTMGLEDSFKKKGCCVIL